MAFQLVDISTLPVREFGRRATEARVSITENGQFQFNVLVQKAWEGIGKLLVQFDAEKNLLAFKGYKLEDKVKVGKDGKTELPETKFLKVKWGTDKDGKPTGTLSASGAAILTSIKYDFSTAGNQSYELVFDEKTKLFVLEVPKTTPARKVAVPRRKKVAAGIAVATNGTPAVPVAPPAEDDLMMLTD